MVAFFMPKKWRDMPSKWRVVTSVHSELDQKLISGMEYEASQMTLRDLLEETREFLAEVWKGVEPVVTDFMEVITWQTNWLDAHLIAVAAAVSIYALLMMTVLWRWKRRRHIKWKRSALTEAEMMNIANAQNSKRTQKEILELEEQNRARL